MSHPLPPVYKGLGDFSAHYDHFIVDIWGVLHDGNHAYPGAIAAMEYLKAAGKQVLLLSNSPNRAQRVVNKVLTPIGVPADTYQHIITSGEAAHHYMEKHYSGQKVYTFWDDEIPTALEDLNITRVFDVQSADFIYASLLPYNSTAETYTGVLQYALDKKLTLICGNPDRVVINAGGLHLCVGTLAEVYEKQGGHVIWIGKPYRPIYEQAWELLGKPDKKKIVAIGDGLLTDVGGAASFGCDVVWNIEGIHWDEIATNDRIDPHKVKDVLHGQPQPAGLMHGFNV